MSTSALVRSSVLALALAGSLLACTDRQAGDDDQADDEAADASDASGDDADDSDDAPLPADALELQGITVYSKYYEGSIVVLDFTTHPDASCADLFPWHEDSCEHAGVWRVSLELVSDNAAPGTYREPDFNFWDSHYLADFDGTCTPAALIDDTLLDEMVLVIEQGSPGVRGRVDDMAVMDAMSSRISGSFRSVPCQ